MNRTRIATWKPLYPADMLRAAGRAPLVPFRRSLSMAGRAARGPAVHTLLRRCQLVSGMVLLVYLSLHLVNHALGIWSLDLAGRGLALALRVWRSAPGTLLLYGASLLHFSLALRTIYGRRHWKMPLTEWVRLWAVRRAGHRRRNQ